jgi:predicted cupin superfamily sugar epimerase
VTRSGEHAIFSEMDPDEIIELLGLTPLPDEGGMWRQVLLDQYSSAIFYLLAGDDFSALHRLPHPEIYHHYAGSALELLVLGADGGVTRPVLGIDLEAGERPAIIVPGGAWQGSRPRGAWCLVGTTMAPAFSFDTFELGDRAELQQRYPSEVATIDALTR